MQQNGRTTISGNIDSTVKCKTVHGFALEASVSRLSRHMVVFEVNDFNCVLGTSEVLNEFTISLGDKTLYSGRAVVANLINTGAGFLCEATLDGIGLNLPALDASDGAMLKRAFSEFLANWGKNYRIDPDFKVLIADMTSYLTDLRLWLDHVEMTIGAAPAENRARLEQQALAEVFQPAVFSLNALFEKFELVASKIREEDRPAHRTFCRRQLHPLLLCSPFMNRIYTKPLGYAGDYEMVNMILRNSSEGDSLYARLLNIFILSQSPAIAHRNRVHFLTQKLLEETGRVATQGRTAKVFNIGCGPAGELQDFIREHSLADRLDATLLDSNDETLTYTEQMLTKIKHQNQRRTTVRMVKKSVYQLLKPTIRTRPNAGEFDLIYCAGLFDYLNDPACEALLNLFYSQLLPGGLLVATNVASHNPIRNIMEYIFDWHLVYRSGREFAAIAPKAAPLDAVVVTAEESSTNIFIEMRKPL